MKHETKATNPAVTAGPAGTAAAPAKVEPEKPLAPIFVDAEKMFEKIADLTRMTTQRAFEYFLERGGRFGRELEDWVLAESEILRPVAVEITEKPEFFAVRAAVPGFKPEEIEISVKDNLLILSGETEMKENKEEENLFYSEWRSNRFCRKLSLPTDVVADKVTANLKDGVLELMLPKAEKREATKVAITNE